MSLHTERTFEDEICAALAERGWIYEAGSAADYDRSRALYPPDLLSWVQHTQPEAWAALVESHGAGAGEALVDRVRSAIHRTSLLEVLRGGVELVGVRERVRLVEFKPAHGFNPETGAHYAANRLRVVRQLHYSSRNENSLDLALFVNGLPTATLELKSEYTQSVQDAVAQYRRDRHPSPPGAPPEPLLTFLRGALVHFAVSQAEVYMTTRLAGPATRFLPFNCGFEGAAGNPPNPDGFATAYLWEAVLERESWLEILGRYLCFEKDEAEPNKITGLVFPRYHQLDATRRLREEILKDGPGARYLIQHSAGSGKTHSIAWTAHFLADLHDAQNRKLFDSVLVISDRTVIDSQLREAIYQSEDVRGVVQAITGDHGSKSRELLAALAGNRKIVVCTLQTFPAAIKIIEELSRDREKRFAVIADEAHSSQTGDAAKRMKEFLNASEQSDLEDGGEVSVEDLLAEQMAARAELRRVSFIAFTATPKAKTMELFGRRPDPARPPGPDNIPAPFHVYSMRQAIEEGFILDVLQNYITFKFAFELTIRGEHYRELEVERNRAMRDVLRWVRLRPETIASKVEIVVEHFREVVQPLLDGRARAMVVTASRKEAVLWQRALLRYIAAQGYALESLVAFSGDIADPDTGESVNETSPALNPHIKKSDLRRAFKDPRYQFMVVANKFQTGFDEPLLSAMYVDKRLGGVQAVQTLARLNRKPPGKERVYVLDFVNNPNEILAAFRTYYDTAELSGVTDPNLILDLGAKLDATGNYDRSELEAVVRCWIEEERKPAPRKSAKRFDAALQPVVTRLKERYKRAREAFKIAEAEADVNAAQAARATMDALELFRRDVGAYWRAYVFLSQIYDYKNTDIEKRAIFCRLLSIRLDYERESSSLDLSQLELVRHNFRKVSEGRLAAGGGERTKLDPLTDLGSGQTHLADKARLEEIVERINELFNEHASETGGFKKEDTRNFVSHMQTIMTGSELLRKQALNNSREQFSQSPNLNQELMNAAMEASEAHRKLSAALLNSEPLLAGMARILLNDLGLWERLRAEAQRGAG